MTDASTARPVLSGRYELHRRIARGGMADVFLARDQLLDRPVAVKVLFPQYAAEPTFVARFRREAQAAANLNHPSVVAVYDWGSHEDTYFIVMEYVEGRSLADVLASEGHLHPDRAAEIATDVAAALGFAHRNGTVHRDVKPGNIMITPAGQVKVTDFGIARAFGGGDDELTQTGSVMGTASYFSPEQAQGKPVDPRSDLYSLGVVLFEMVTGDPPFTGASPVSIAYKHVQEPAPQASSLNPSVPPPLDAVINRLLAKSPEQRYAAAEDVRADLRRFREGQPLSGAPAGFAQATAYAPPEANEVMTTAMPRPSMNGPAPRPVDTGSARAIIDTTRAVPASAAVRQEEPVEEYYEPPSRTGVFLIMLAGLLVLLIGLIFYISTAIAGDSDAEAEPAVDQVEVPTVIGDLSRTAKNRLEDAGLVVQIEFAENDDEDPDVVFDQDPAPRTPVDEGSTVIIYVVKAEEQVVVPDVVGLLDEDARRLIDEAGLTVRPKLEPSDEFDEGEVISQNPPADDQVNLGTDVEIIVSSGPEQKAIPTLEGMSVADANKLLADEGFSNVRLISEPSADHPKDTVISTNPEPGTVVDLDSLVEIVGSDGAGQAEVPSVTGMAQQAAEVQLRDLGFVPKVELVDAPQGQEGRVQSQTPAPGTQAEIGTEVIIRVGQTGSDTTDSTQNDGGGDGGGGDDDN